MSDQKVYDPATDNVPSTVRIAAVQHYILKEPALKDKLGESDIGVKKRDGQIVYFSAEVYGIAKKLHDDGKDVLKIGKTEILVAARQFFGIVSAPTAQSKSFAASERGLKLIRASVQGMLSLACDLVTDLQKTHSIDKEIAAELAQLQKVLGLSGDTNTTPLIPYTLVLSASQIADRDPEMVKHRQQFEAVVKRFAKISIAT